MTCFRSRQEGSVLVAKVDQLKGYVAERGVLPPWLRKGGGFDRIVGFQVRFVKDGEGRTAFVVEPSKYGGSNPTPKRWFKIVELPVFLPVNIVYDGVEPASVELAKWSRQINRRVELVVSGWVAGQLVEDASFAPVVGPKDLSAPVGSQENPVLVTSSAAAGQ